MRVKEGKNILLADDQKESCIKKTEILTCVGHNVSFAKDGEDIIQKLRKDSHGLDLLVIDLQKSSIDGFDVLMWLRDNNRLGNPSVLILTEFNYSSDIIIERLKPLEATGFLSRGGSQEQLVFAVHSMLYPYFNKARRRPRVPVFIPVVFAFEKKLNEGNILNISETGLFIRTKDCFDAGSTIRMKFAIEGKASSIVAEGTVVWSNNLTGVDMRFNGMGIYFTKIRSDDRAAIASFVKQELDKCWFIGYF